MYEAAQQLGGGARTDELTLPGFRHDLCSAIHPLARASPVFRELGIDWVEPPAECAHPFDDGSALLLGFDLGDGEVTVVGSTSASGGAAFEPDRLALSRQIAEAHGGSLTLANRAGPGCEALLRLPK